MLTTVITILLLTLISFATWFMFGKDESVSPVVNTLIPSKRNSAQFEVEYKGTSSYKGIASLIPYLASKGYIIIEEHDISYTLKKVKDYNGKNTVEGRIMNSLFSKGDSITKEEIENLNIFHSACKSALKKLNTIQGFIFEKNACTAEKLAILFICILGTIVSMIYSLGNYSFDVLFKSDSVYIWISAIIIILMCIFISSKRTTAIIVSTLLGCLLAAYPFYYIFVNTPNINNCMPVILLGFVGIIISSVCLSNMPKRNRRGNKVLSEILGLKEFLESGRLKQLEKLIDENPNYAYDMLPYSYILDSTDRFVMDIEQITHNNFSPAWYKGKFTSYNFVSLVNSIEALLTNKN